MKIVVASHNPVKLQAALGGLQAMFAHEQFEVEGVSVGSGVSDQPSDDAETAIGAHNRAVNARQAQPAADYWVGLEGGIEAKDDRSMESFAWVVIIDKTGRVGKARTGTFFLPAKVASLIQEGKELGEADDIVFGQTNSKQANGAVGLLTGDVVKRADYYMQAVIMAAIPFKNSDLY